MNPAPSLNGSNGRQTGGQFGPGNRFGRGNPHAHRVHAIQALIRDETTDDDLRAIWRRMIQMAKAGDKDAAKMVLDRVMGKVRDVEPEPPEPGDSEPPKTVLLDWRLSPAKAVELLARTEAGDTAGVCEVLRQHAGV